MNDLSKYFCLKLYSQVKNGANIKPIFDIFAILNDKSYKILSFYDKL
jgi:hypothetical protein